jgi:AraC-like DNA-binding protein
MFPRFLNYINRMAYAEYPPAPALQDWVKCFWSIQEDPSETVQEVWPDGCIELLFNLGNNFLVNADGRSQAFPKVVVIGLQTKTMRVRSEGEVRLLGARMLPFGVRSWKSEELHSLGMDVERQLRLGQFQVAVHVLEAWLLRQPKMEDNLTLALRTLYANNGNMTVADMAISQGVSSRQMQRIFAKRLGISPKTLAKVVRFAGSWSRLLDKPDLSLAELALELGYSDQAHFSNEFRSFGKQSPRTFCKDWSKPEMSPFYKT